MFKIPENKWPALINMTINNQHHTSNVILGILVYT